MRKKWQIIAAAALLSLIVAVLIAAALVAPGPGSAPTRSPDSTQAADLPDPSPRAHTTQRSDQDAAPAEAALIESQAAQELDQLFAALRAAYDSEDWDQTENLQAQLLETRGVSIQRYLACVKQYVMESPTRHDRSERLIDETLVALGHRLFAASAQSARVPLFTEVERVIAEIAVGNSWEEARAWLKENAAAADTMLAVPLASDYDTRCLFQILAAAREQLPPSSRMDGSRPISSVLSARISPDNRPLYRVQIETCDYLAALGARMHIPDLVRLRDECPCREVRDACNDALARLGYADAHLELELSLATLTADQKWSDLKVAIERSLANHPNLSRVLPLVVDGIVRSSGLWHQELSFGLLKGITARQRKQASGKLADSELDLLLQAALASRSGKAWYQLAPILLTNYYPTAPEGLLQYMESLLVDGFDDAKDYSPAYLNLLSVSLVFTEDVPRLLNLCQRITGMDEGRTGAVRLFLDGVLPRKFLSGKANHADSAAVMDFLPAYTDTYLRTVDRTAPSATDATAAEENPEESPRVMARNHVREIWLMLQPDNPSSVQQALATLAAQSTSAWAAEVCRWVVVEHELFRVEYLSEDYDKPDWPMWVKQPNAK